MSDPTGTDAGAPALLLTTSTMTSGGGGDPTGTDAGAPAVLLTTSTMADVSTALPVVLPTTSGSSCASAVTGSPPRSGPGAPTAAGTQLATTGTSPALAAAGAGLAGVGGMLHRRLRLALEPTDLLPYGGAETAGPSRS